MNGQEPTTPNAALLALITLIAAAAVIAALLLGDSWTRWVYYTALGAGVLVAAGSLGALVRVLGRHGN